ncbi:hypothetical protein ACIBI9_50235 [Nonomuraea sp. NPDC050451]|uniref:hypothetical protein n=1 Tax=Nonomuraea sp. NPDC050451 TaxID=3364364 RepID=UPI00379B82A7
MKARQATSPAPRPSRRSSSRSPGSCARSPIRVPSSVVFALRAYLDHFGLVFGCFDFALEADETANDPYRWIFLECNPNGQWGWPPDAGAIAGAFAETLLEGWFA